MQILSINFISFTAQIYIMHCICKAKRATLASWEHGPFAPPLNPPVSSQVTSVHLLFTVRPDWTNEASTRYAR